MTLFRKLTQAEAVERIKEVCPKYNYEVVDLENFVYTGSTMRLKCKHKWYNIYNKLYYSKQGCPRCANVMMLDEAEWLKDKHSVLAYIKNRF